MSVVVTLVPHIVAATLQCVAGDLARASALVLSTRTAAAAGATAAATSKSMMVDEGIELGDDGDDTDDDEAGAPAGVPLGSHGAAAAAAAAYGVPLAAVLEVCIRARGCVSEHRRISPDRRNVSPSHTHTPRRAAQAGGGAAGGDDDDDDMMDDGPPPPAPAPAPKSAPEIDEDGFETVPARSKRGQRRAPR